MIGTLILSLTLYSHTHTHTGTSATDKMHEQLLKFKKINSKVEEEYRSCTQIPNLLPKSHGKKDLERRWRIFKVASSELIRLA